MATRKPGYLRYFNRYHIHSIGHTGLGTRSYTSGSITTKVLYYRYLELLSLTNFGDGHYRLVCSSRYHPSRAVLYGIRYWLRHNGILTGYHRLRHSSTARTVHGTIPVVHNRHHPMVWSKHE